MIFTLWLSLWIGEGCITDRHATYMYRIATGSFTNAVSSTDVMMLLVRCTLQDLLIKVKRSERRKWIFDPGDETRTHRISGCELVKVSTNTCKQSIPVYHYYQDNVFPSEVQLDIFCHENLHDFTDCFYPELYLPSLKVWVLRLHKRIRGRLFWSGLRGLCSVWNTIYRLAGRLMNTHASWDYAARRIHVHNHMCVTVSGKWNILW